MNKSWTPENQEEIGNALITAQNALVGYVQLSNAPETEEHHKLALDALKTVQEAIRAASVLEQQGIVPWSERTRGIQAGDKVTYSRDQSQSAGRQLGEIPNA